MIQLTTKEFVIDGHNMKSMEEFWDEVQTVLASGFPFFGRNLDAFKDILLGGFGAFTEGENIKVKFIHRNFAKQHLSENFLRKIIQIIEESDNVELVIE